MPRVGELLIEAGLVTPGQVAEGMRAQVLWGARLGTILVELGFLDLDPLTQILGRQHKLPAALKAHFEGADASVQRRLSPRLAKLFACVPLVRAGKRVVIASITPQRPADLVEIARELGVEREQIIQAVGAELRIRYWLERVYRIERDPRFLRAHGTRSEDSQVFQIVPTIDPELEAQLSVPQAEEVSVVDGIPRPVGGSIDDDDRELPPPLAEPVGIPVPYDPMDGERRRYLKTLADLLTGHPDQASVMARVDKLSGVQAGVRDHARGPAQQTLQAATHVIFKGRDRDEVAARALDAVAQFVPEVRAALLLVVRGDAAVSWTGFCRDGTELPALAVPLHHPGLLPVVLKRRAPVRSSSGDLNPIDFVLLASLGARHGELVVAPVMLGVQVIAVFALATTHRASVDGIETVTMAAGAALARLMRDASM